MTEITAIQAQAEIHHQFLLGLQLRVSMVHGPQAIGDWIFRLFRRQHDAKFLSSFSKLGLDGLPHAVACARYHVLSNGIGGVPVEYMEESPRKAWVRFRYPRWMFDGPAICGIPVEASRGFLRGWYAQNGVSLGNPRLGYVCVSEDMGGFGLCGYIIEEDRDLAPDERLRFRPHERPPDWDAAAQPVPPPGQWTEIRLAKANRNYAVEYIRNGIATLSATLGREAALPLAQEAARLTGLQCWRHVAGRMGAPDSGPTEAGALLAALFRAMGDGAEVAQDAAGIAIHHTGLRIVRGLDGQDRADLLDCWQALWGGMVQSHRAFMQLTVTPQGDGLIWNIRQR